MTDTPSNYGYAMTGRVARACLRCGSMVADTDVHDAFHDQLDTLLGVDDEQFDPEPILTMPKVNGTPFRCMCGANVFQHDKARDLFRCNACKCIFQGG